jgi:hypothetical protein
VRLTLVNVSYQKIDGRDFIFIFIDLGSKFLKKKKLREFLILKG